MGNHPRPNKLCLVIDLRFGFLRGLVLGMLESLSLFIGKDRPEKDNE